MICTIRFNIADLLPLGGAKGRPGSARLFVLVRGHHRYKVTRVVPAPGRSIQACIDAELRLHEARQRAPARLVPAYHGYREEADAIYRVESWVDGESLKDWIQGDHSLAERYAMALAVIAAVLWLFDARLVHRDIKPSNFIVVGCALVLIDLESLQISGRVPDEDVGTDGFVAQETAVEDETARRLLESGDFPAAVATAFEVLTAVGLPIHPSLGAGSEPVWVTPASVQYLDKNAFNLYLREVGVSDDARKSMLLCLQRDERQRRSLAAVATDLAACAPRRRWRLGLSTRAVAAVAATLLLSVALAFPSATSPASSAVPRVAPSGPVAADRMDKGGAESPVGVDPDADRAVDASPPVPAPSPPPPVRTAAGRSPRAGVAWRLNEVNQACGDQPPTGPAFIDDALASVYRDADGRWRLAFEGVSGPRQVVGAADEFVVPAGYRCGNKGGS